jgi:signal transduction histidine kinase
MQAHRFEEGVGLLGKITQSGHAEYINRPSQDPRTRKLPGSWDETVGSDDDLYPLMAAPFHLEDGSRGVICLWRHVKQGFFDDNDLEFLRGLAHQTAVAFTNAQLYTQAKLAQKSAEASNRAKDNFLATMSHEFRTPLNAILGYAQLMQRTPHFPEHHREGLNAILHSGQHLLALITDMLDLAKVEAGKMELTPNAFFLPELLNVTAKIVQVWATDKKLTFHLQNDTNLTMLVYGDRRRLQQVLLNLINNAIKFTPHGHITLRVDLVSLTPFKPAPRQPNLPIDPIGETELQFEVQDTGIGIAAEDLTKIFTPFEQGRPYNRPQEGTGLGLAISQSLLGLMGSAIQVDSTPGKGSTFSFRLRLPLIRSQHQHPERIAPPPCFGPPTAAHPARHHALAPQKHLTKPAQLKPARRCASHSRQFTPFNRRKPSLPSLCHPITTILPPLSARSHDPMARNLFRKNGSMSNYVAGKLFEGFKIVTADRRGLFGVQTFRFALRSLVFRHLKQA